METSREMTLEEWCKDAREKLKILENVTRRYMNDDRFNGEQKFPYQHTEIKANIMLTIRHIEDARMRLGKVLQYADDGISILDK